MIQIGLLVIAAGMLWAGIQCLRGKPDRDGKKTSLGVSIASFVLAAVIAVFAVVGLPLVLNSL
jgi:hypothetical protein